MLHGIIGKDVNGASIAKEIKMLNDAGAKEIVERINSLGGSVNQGFSIVSANIASKAKVTTVCEGVCDSIAAVIFATGDERKILSFGSLMIHNVSLGGISLEKMKEGPDKDSAVILNDSIVNILEARTGETTERIKELMAKETRFNCDDALNFGIADTKIDIIGAPELVENLTREEYMNICKDFKADEGQNIDKNKSNMKKVFKQLGLAEEASEESVLAAVKELQNKAEEVTGLKTKVATLETEKKEAVKAKAAQEVQNCIEKGLFDDSKKEEMVNLAADAPEVFSAIIAGLKPEYTNISDDLVSGKKKKESSEKKEEDLAKEYQNLMETDPEALSKLEATNKSAFDKMYEAWSNAE